MSFKRYIKEIESQNNSKTIEIYFTDLDEVIQKQVMDQLLEALNAKADDSFANKKIMDTLSKNPIFITTGDEITKQINFDL